MCSRVRYACAPAVTAAAFEMDQESVSTHMTRVGSDHIVVCDARGWPCRRPNLLGPVFRSCESLGSRTDPSINIALASHLLGGVLRSTDVTTHQLLLLSHMGQQ